MPDQNTDPILKQLEKTPTSMSIWGVLATSCEHHRRLINTLSKLEVAADITPEAMIALITPSFAKHTLAFTEKTYHLKEPTITSPCTSP